MLFYREFLLYHGEDLDMKHKKVTILGGDMRQATVAGVFADKGITVHVYGIEREALPKSSVVHSDWRSAVKNTACLVLPLPISLDGKRVNLPMLEGAAPQLCEVFSELPSGALVLGGKISEKQKKLIEAYGLGVADYFESEALQEANALPTAEGAVQILMREMPRVISGMPIAVTGYGRVSRALVKLLLAMGAKVCVFARKECDTNAAKELGATAFSLESKEFCEAGERFAAIFNTVPAVIFTKEILKGISTKTLLIDLASAPGGFDQAVSTMGFGTIYALSLPGKYAPVTAGELIADVLLDMMKKEGLV